MKGASRFDDGQSASERLRDAPFRFEFFQAVNLLERIAAREGSPSRIDRDAPIEFRATADLHFPAATIRSLSLAARSGDRPVVEQTFFGLLGPAGSLPRVYTEQVLVRERGGDDKEKGALRAWLDLLPRRLLWLFYLAWEKYHPRPALERGEFKRADPDTLTKALFSFVGIGLRSQRGRLAVATSCDGKRESLAAINDLALLRYAGILAQRPRTAWGLATIIGDYFQIPARVEMFVGQWLLIDPPNQTRLGVPGGNGVVGVSAVVGAKVWDVQGKIRVALGPLRRDQFIEFLPDTSRNAERKAIFLLFHLARFYAGTDFDIAVELRLAAGEVPECQLNANAEPGPRLGWNCWARSRPMPADAHDAVFAAPLSPPTTL